MAGYGNRTILLDFPELSEPGDRVHVIIRNPKTVPLQDLMPPQTPGQEDAQAQLRAGMSVIARLVQAWHVYDATSLADDQPLLPLPATPDLVAKLPMEIQNRISEEIAKVRSAGA
ncbi:hypothetical protein E6W39_24195 [Kitasatospora acidiphila]|uniref:Uncharacterized protein n=1 Tax=Kitasatospora acidiphila TaxID=2567942 RepID=A0A540W6V1_9ACTN|nr:hypothetical protein [Kitasatospora acidiphila]TQF04758.1 hypothetical protein E6W39_24195 [Kitasatospora acidiphila]